MPELITTALIKQYCLSNCREQSGKKKKKSIFKENENGWITYICISAMFIHFHLTLMCIKWFVDTMEKLNEKNKFPIF